MQRLRAAAQWAKFSATTTQSAVGAPTSQARSCCPRTCGLHLALLGCSTLTIAVWLPGDELSTEAFLTKVATALCVVLLTCGIMYVADPRWRGFQHDFVMSQHPAKHSFEGSMPPMPQLGLDGTAVGCEAMTAPQSGLGGLSQDEQQMIAASVAEAVLADLDGQTDAARTDQMPSMMAPQAAQLPQTVLGATSAPSSGMSAPMMMQASRTSIYQGPLGTTPTPSFPLSSQPMQSQPMAGFDAGARYDAGFDAVGSGFDAAAAGFDAAGAGFCAPVPLHAPPAAPLQATGVPLQAASPAVLQAAHAAALQDADLLRHYSIDVECVASGRGHNDRVVAQISLVRGDGTVLLNLYVKPAVPVVSYITPLTGLTRELLEEQGMPFNDALVALRRALPRDAILVGQGIDNDVRWLGLVQGQDFAGLQDLAGLWRAWNKQFNSFSVYSQEHLAKVLLGEDINGGAHNAVDDAVKAIKLFRLHRQLSQLGPLALEEAKQRLMISPVTPPFKKRHPCFEGVCMGDKKTCCCGSPFYFK
eukprot:TRINITY_DN59517_c0_g1_i1.p1 TRINITY_DN59517_c0_g1~~TRINITY_DN59517_c0_g1_i1.p1  ORF type:complete len:530 (-),score=95.03 TRINITY_DN59517_c0_g1_i1:193-1782(-)